MLATKEKIPQSQLSIGNSTHFKKKINDVEEWDV